MGKRILKLRLLSDAIPDIAQKALAATAESIGDIAQQNAPVRTGELRDSKKIEIAYLMAIVGFTAPHANHVNFGTSRQAANAFFTFAWFQGLEIFKNNLLTEVNKAIV